MRIIFKFFLMPAVFIGILLVQLPDLAESTQSSQKSVRRVIIISFDGLRPDILTSLGKEKLPNFFTAMQQGAFTLNARTDPDWTLTMPNHTSMLTGRGVNGSKGHNYIDNLSLENSIHKIKGSYVHSIFDAAKVHNKTTGLFASKLKFQVFLNSYSPDIKYLAESDSSTLTSLLDSMENNLPDLNFVHLASADNAGHAADWGGATYLNAVVKLDQYLGSIIDKIKSSSSLSKTILILTADHGGLGNNHFDFKEKVNYRVPFIVWGKGIAKDRNLYRLNKGIRKNPRDKQIPYNRRIQPIRNADTANAALRLLNLKPIRGSYIGKLSPLIFNPS